MVWALDEELEVLWCADWLRVKPSRCPCLVLYSPTVLFFDCEGIAPGLDEDSGLRSCFWSGRDWTSVTDLFVDCDAGCVMWSVDLFLDRRTTEYVTMPGPPARSIFSGGLVLRMRGIV